MEDIRYRIQNKDKERQWCKLKLIGTIMTEDTNEILYEIKQLTTEEGFSVLKVKVGRNVKKDIEKIKIILDIIPDNARIRIDANQGYSFSDAKEFINSIHPDKIKKIELFEQPLKIEEWINMSRLNELSELPLMLDESICDEEDIIRALSLKCCSFIKLKLMKQGSFTEMEKMFNFANENGLNVIIGNGVQSEIGCINEAYIINKLNANKFASENNGFFKQSKRFLEKNIIKDSNNKFVFNFNFNYDSFYYEIKPFIIKESNF
jgi:L-alanine-DL-glutamate epimerase-like enolase superfamily enzyme